MSILHPEILTRPEDKWPTRILIGGLIVFAVLVAAIPLAHADIGSTENLRSASRSTVTHQRVVKRKPVAKRVKVASVKQKGVVRTASAQVVGGRPPECYIRIKGHLIPFCGCALSVKLFGKVIPDLMLADNWRRRFPATRPEPGMVAARSGHVFQLVRHVSGDRWVVWDANSGGGLTRIHERRIAGYSIVNPNASRVAMK